MKVILFGALLMVSLPLAAAEKVQVEFQLVPGRLQVEPSFEAASFYFRAPAGAAKPFTVEFRRVGDASWTPAFEPVSDRPAGIWKGSLFNLAEDTAYEAHVIGRSAGEVIAPVAFRTWTSRPKIAKTIDLSTLSGAEKGIVITDHGTPDGWIEYTAPPGWRIDRPNDLDDAQRGAITLRGARYVIVENVTVVGGARHAILVEKSESVRILNCDLSGWGRVGVQQYTNTGTRGKYADAHGELINLDGGVEIDHSARTVVERCYIHDPRGRANSWQYSHPAGPSAVHTDSSLGGTVLRWNDCIGSDEHRWNDVLEASSNASVEGGFFRDTDVTGNFLAFGNDDGVELEGGGMNVRFYRNKIEGTTCGISTGPCFLGPQFIFGNLVANEGDETGLALMLFKNSHRLPQSGKRHFVNNTLFTPSSAPYGNYGKPSGDERIGYMRNNVFFASSARLPDEKMRRDDFDGDLFWTDCSAEASNAYLAGLRRIGQEPHGLAANPQFVAPARGDFHLSAGSPALGRSLAVANLAAAGINLGAFADAATEVPYRPLVLTAVPRQLNFHPTDGSRSLEVRVSVPASAPKAVPFEIRQNRVFTWFTVSPASGVVKPGETVTLTVKVNAVALAGRPLFRGAFLVRTPSGLSRPVTVYAAVPFQENLRPAAAAPNTAYIEAAALPALTSHVRTTDAPGVFGGRFVALSKDEAPEIRAQFSVPEAARYVLLVRASIRRGVMNRRAFAVSVDGGATVAMEMTPDYNWNTDNDRFRAVYGCSLGELKPGAHDLRFTVKGGLNLNEIIVTDTPSAFMADGWQQEHP
jgi:hypothetical protein